jgi:hypothetical protein
MIAGLVYIWRSIFVSDDPDISQTVNTLGAME